MLFYDFKRLILWSSINFTAKIGQKSETLIFKKLKPTQVKIAIIKRLVPEKIFFVLVVHFKQTWKKKLGKKIEKFFCEVIFFPKISLFCDFINKNQKSPKIATI